jgi:hypothetical protein
MKSVLIICSLLFIKLSFGLSQDWCNRKPAKFENSPFDNNEKLNCDRFFHTINPDVVKCRHFQIESAFFLRDEYYDSPKINGSKVPSTFNLYSSYKLRYAISNIIEIHVSLNEQIINSGSEITDYAGVNPNSRFSIGTKFLIYKTENNNSLGLYCQLTFPKQLIDYSIISPDIRILYSIGFTKNLNLIGNLGGVYIDKYHKIFLYAFELDWFINKKVKLIAECYRNYINPGYIERVNNRLLAGVGFYIKEKFYFYSTIENGFDHNELLRTGKMDLGLTYIF